MTVSHKYFGPLLFTSLLLTIGCGSASTNVAATNPNTELTVEEEFNTDDVEILDGIAVAPQTDESAIPLKSRGDAFYYDSGIVYRGATSGLIIGEIDHRTSEFVERAAVFLPDAVNDIVVHKKVAYAACGPSGVAVIDVKTPDKPVHLAAIDTRGAAIKLAIAENILVIADGAMGIVLIDIEDPKNPKTVSLWPSSGYVRDVIVDEKLIYVAEDRAGVSLLRMKLNGKKVELQWRHHTKGQARSLFLGKNGCLFVANGPDGVLALDISDRKGPNLLGKIPLADTARDIGALPRKNRLFVANGDDGVLVLDTTDLSAMKIIGKFETSTPANRVYQVENHLFVGNDSSGLLKLDISNPDEPVLVFPAKNQ